jgi:hypothetical protein
MPLKICCARVPADAAAVGGWEAGLLGGGGVDRGAFTDDEAVDEVAVAEADALEALPLADGLRADAAALLEAGALLSAGPLLDASEVRTPPEPGLTRLVHAVTPTVAIKMAPIHARIMPPNPLSH